MSILYDEATRIFHLQTEHSSYQMQVGPYGSLLHLYYGPRVEDGLGHLYTPKERGFSGNPADTGNDRTFSFDTAPQEYSCFGGADYRTACLEAVSAQGAGDLDLRYASHRTGKGKPALPGLRGRRWLSSCGTKPGRWRWSSFTPCCRGMTPSRGTR